MHSPKNVAPKIESTAAFSERHCCPFCSSRSDEVLTRIRYHETVGAQPEFPDVQGALLACRSCGIAYPSHIYPLELFSTVYRRLIERQVHFHRSKVQRLRVLFLREILRNRARRYSLSSFLDGATRHALLVPLFRREPGALRVLDVGAGFGDFAEAFRALGDHVETTEIVPELVEYLRGLGFRSHLGELEHVGLDGAEFDVIFMRGTLYRTRDPAATIEAARRLLSPRGVIASLDTCPGGHDGAEYWARMQFPQGQFYIIDRARYGSMLQERFGLRVDRERLIYGRPESHLKNLQIFGALLEFGEMFLNNLARRKPFVLAYSLVPVR